MTDIDNNHIFENPGFATSQSKDIPNIIKVIGVGGGGNNAINHMYTQNIKGVSFVVCNTDRQALLGSDVPTKVLLGEDGLGAGNKPEVAKKKAEDSTEKLAALFDDETKMVFITAGMGGGTGTGAAPVVAKIAKDKGVLTIGIVTIPFLFEGEKKILKALKGADEMSKYVDALLIINNERLTEIYSELDFMNAFGKADDTLSTAAQSISDLITYEGKINIDFNDVDTTLRNGGVAIISSGVGEGERRVTKAIENALNSPLLKNRDVYGSKNILVNIYFSQSSQKKFVMDEVNEMREFMSNFAPEVDVIWGVATDESLGEKVKITILAAGFNVTLDNEVSNAKKKRIAPVEQQQADGTSRLIDEYGKEKIAERQQEMARAKYMVMKLEDYDNDELIDLIERTPTFARDVKSRDLMKNVQSHAANARAAAEAPKTTTDGQTIMFS